MIKVSACIVNYRDIDNTLAALSSVTENTKGVELCMYVVDNASGDDSCDVLRKEFPFVHVICSDVNGGYGRGHNMVLPLLDSKYHAVINPDITLVGDVLSDMAFFFENNHDIGIACPAILNPDMTPQALPRLEPTVRYMMSGRLPGMKRCRDEYTMAKEDMSVVRDIDFITGCFMFMRTELFKKVGGFDERYFMYMEDADLGREIKRYARAVHYPGASVIHKWARTDKRNLKLLLAHFDSAFKYLKKWKGREEK